jgi:hypothetical protein
MKTILASLLALSLLGAGAANAGGVGVGVHVGSLHVGVGAHGGRDHRDHGRQHHRARCVSWGGHGHHRYCRHWSR